ncbi:Ig-like domain-containing protein [Anaerosporobacter sp.]|uniref:Ig-like domain-containing protein n=1 Tax=Anaerosporobacter sp. TaxID=1872529 RepID=UPI0028A1FE42|nr:Ig-like domain-containing protein [Anaerosporobacter sp.]
MHLMRLRRQISVCLAAIVMVTAVPLDSMVIQSNAETVNEDTITSTSYQDVWGTYGVIDTIDLGDFEDEKAHKMDFTYSQIITGESGENARVSLPKEVVEYWGGEIAFTIKVEPDAQNYFTLKLWGSDIPIMKTYLAIDNEIIFKSPLVITTRTSDQPAGGRFYYSTVPIPIEKTKGKTELTVSIKTGADTYPYGAGSVEKHFYRKMDQQSAGYYYGYVHTTASLAGKVIKDTTKSSRYFPSVNTVATTTEEEVVITNLEAKAKSILETVVATSGGDGYKTTSWTHTDNAAGSGSMLMPYSQNVKNTNNMRTIVDMMSESKEYDEIIKEVGFDNIIDAIRNGCDRLVINYLNRPATIQTGGHQSSWGGFYQGMGEALYVIYEMFENGRAIELGTSYTDYESWLKGNEKINWQETFSSVAKFLTPDQPFRLEKAQKEYIEGHGETSRKTAYEEILWLNFNYARTHAYTLTPLTNQVMFQMLGAWLSNAGLMAIGSEKAEDMSSAIRFLYRSMGVWAYLDIDVIDGTVEAVGNSDGKYNGDLVIENIEAFNNVYSTTGKTGDKNTETMTGNRIYNGEYRKVFGENYYMVTDAGLTRETTYAAGYGEHSDMLVEAYRLTKDLNFLKLYLEASNARTHMRYAAVDSYGNRVMSLEATIECRGPYYPYKVGYLGTLDSSSNENKPFTMAYLKKILVDRQSEFTQMFGEEMYLTNLEYANNAVNYAKQMLMDGQYVSKMGASSWADIYTASGYQYVKSETANGALMPGTNVDWYSEAELEALGVDKGSFNSYTEAVKNQLNETTFYDIDDSVIMFRNEDTTYYIELQYKSDPGLNGMSRIHTINSEYDTIAMVEHEVGYTPSGFWNTETDWANYDIAYDPVTVFPDQVINAKYGEILPVAKFSDSEEDYQVQPTKSGSPFGGYGEFYSFQYNQYVIAMNTTRVDSNNAKDYAVVLPSSYTADTVKDLVSGKNLTVLNGKVTIPAYSCAVLDLGAESYISDIPMASIFTTAVADGNIVAVSWTHGGYTNKEYQVYRSEAAENLGELIGTVESDKNVYVDDTIIAGKVYYYRVVGVNKHGVSGNPSVYTKITATKTEYILQGNWAVMDVDGTTENIQASMVESGAIEFTGTSQNDGALLFAHTTNITDGEVASLSTYSLKLKTGEEKQVTANLEDMDSIETTGDFTYVAKVESGDNTGVMFKESLTKLTRGGFISLNPDTGTYRFSYRQYPSIIKKFNMVPDFYNVYNDMNPLDVTGTVEGAQWIKVERKGFYVYVFVGKGEEKTNVEWIPIGEVDQLRYNTADEVGTPYYLGTTGWERFSEDDLGLFYIPMADAVYVGVASSTVGRVDNISLNNAENLGAGIPGKTKVTASSDNVLCNITLNWTNITYSDTFHVYYTKEAELANTDPVIKDENNNIIGVTEGWTALVTDLRDYKYTIENLTDGTDGLWYFKVVPLNVKKQAGKASDTVSAEVDPGSVRIANSVWKNTDINTRTTGYSLESGSTLSLNTDGNRIWATDGNSFRFMYQEVDAATDGVFITKIKKSDFTNNIGTALMIRDGFDATSNRHTAFMMNETYGLFAQTHYKAGQSARWNEKVVPNGDYYLKLVTKTDKQEFLLYYAPASDNDISYPTADQWILHSTISRDFDTKNWWQDYTTGAGVKWYVGLALATGGVFKSGDFYNTTPVFDVAKITSGNSSIESNHIVLSKDTEITIELNVLDAFGVNPLDKSEIEYVGTLPDRAEYNNGVFTWKPTQVGTTQLTFKAKETGVNDFYGGTDITIEVMEDTNLPVISGIANKTMKAEEKLSMQVQAEIKDTGSFGGVNDSISKNDMTYAVDSIRSNDGREYTLDELGMKLNEKTGLFTWTPGRYQTGRYSLVFSATGSNSSGKNVSTTKTITITVKGAPNVEISEVTTQLLYGAEFTDGKFMNGKLNASATVKAEEAFELLIKPSDPAGNAFFTMTNLPKGATYNTSTGILAWTPSYTQSQVVNPTYTVAVSVYNNNFKEVFTLDITVEEPNDTAPSFPIDWTAGGTTAYDQGQMKVTYNNRAKTSLTLGVGARANGSVGRAATVYKELKGSTTIITRVTDPSQYVKYAGIMVTDRIYDTENVGVQRNNSGVFLATGAEFKTGKNVTHDTFIGMGVKEPGSGSSYDNAYQTIYPSDTTATAGKLKPVFLKLDYAVQIDGTAMVTGAYSYDGTNWTDIMDQATPSNKATYIYSADMVKNGIYAAIFTSANNSANLTTTFDNIQVSTNEIKEVLSVGEEKQINGYAVHPFDEVTYSYKIFEADGVTEIMDSGAKVDTDGMFTWTPTAKGTYKLVITAESKLCDMENSQTYLLEVSNPATNLTLDKETLNMILGGTTQTLTASLIPGDAEDTITWTSSDSSVVTVTPDTPANTATLKQVKKGTATITVTSSGGLRKTCNLTVSSNYIEGQSLNGLFYDTYLNKGTTSSSALVNANMLSIFGRGRYSIFDLDISNVDENTDKAELKLHFATNKGNPTNSGVTSEFYAYPVPEVLSEDAAYAMDFVKLGISIDTNDSVTNLDQLTSNGAVRILWDKSASKTPNQSTTDYTTIDLTELVKSYKQNNPTANAMTFCLFASNGKGGALEFYSSRNSGTANSNKVPMFEVTPAAGDANGIDLTEVQIETDQVEEGQTGEVQQGEGLIEEDQTSEEQIGEEKTGKEQQEEDQIVTEPTDVSMFSVKTMMEEMKSEDPEAVESIATLETDYEVNWTIADSTIAKILVGEDSKTVSIMGLRAGTTVLTATINGRYVATCWVTVERNTDNGNGDNTNGESEENTGTDSAETISKQTIRVDITGSDSTVFVTLNEKGYKSEIAASTPKNPYQLKFDLPSSMIINQIKSDSVKNVKVVVTIPDSFIGNESIVMNDIAVSKQILMAAKENNKTITLAVNSQSQKLLYQWTIKTNDLTKALIHDGISFGTKVTGANTNPAVKKVLTSDTKNTSGVVVTIAPEKVLPVQVTSKVYIGEQAGVKPGKKVYVYYYNNTTKKLDTIPGGYSLVIDAEGYLSLPIIKGGDYVVLAKKADTKVITSLLNQVRITKSMTLKKGKTSTIIPVLPDWLEKVNTMTSPTKFSCVGAVTITYTSNNTSVVSIGKTSGKITAKKKGNAIITATVTLYSGKVKTYKTTVTVK